MTFNEAMKRVLSGHKDCKVLSVLDFKDKFVVSIQPNNWNSDEMLLDPYFAVNKSSGKVSEFSPIMDPEGYKEALAHGFVYKEGDPIPNENEEVIKHYFDYTPDELFHSLSGEDAMMSVMDMTPMDLVHHGIKGQKWGIRRFQPYRQGMKVLGGKVVGAAKKVKQRFTDSVDTHKAKRVAKTEAKAAKKQAKEEKKIEDFEAEKQKAIKTGTAEDLAKFKGKLTPQEYSEAFLRLQNEKKLNELVSANQKSAWDTIDKGIAIVDRLGKYAGILANAKGNYDKLDDALHKKERDEEENAKKNAKEAAKNNFMNKATYEDLVKYSSQFNLNSDEYQKVVSRLSKEHAYKTLAGIKDPEPKEPDHTVRDNAAYDNSKPKDFEAPKKAYDKTPETVKDKAGYKNPDGEKGYEASAQAIESGKRAINGFKAATNKTVYNTEVSLEFGESTVKRLSAKAPNAKQTLKDMEPTAAEKERSTRMANVRNAYSVNREISGAKSGQSGTYRKPTHLEFGDESVSVKRHGYHPSEIVKSTQKTVANTQAESARQKSEAEEKRKRAKG